MEALLQNLPQYIELKTIVLYGITFMIGRHFGKQVKS